MTDNRSRIAPAEIERFLKHALALADEARKNILAAQRSGFSVKRKPDKSFVTSVDVAVEQRLREMIGAQFPEHGILGEELSAVNADAPFQWILDPVDGTEDFAHGIPNFGVILGLHYQGTPLVGVIDHPLLDLRVHAAYGLGAYRNGERIRLTDLAPEEIDGTERITLCARANFTRHGDDGPIFDAIVRAHPNHRIYRTCLAHTLAVTGAVDAMVEYGDRIWDLAASQILIEEAGGKYRCVREWDIPDVGKVYGAVFGKPTLVDRIAERFF